MTRGMTNELAEHFFRHNYAKMTAILTNYFGLSNVEIAEDIVQDTLVEAVEKWSVQSIPDNPEGWLMDVAKKKMINFLKRNQNFKTHIAPNLTLSISPNVPSIEKDSTLKMIFTCCHPLLPTESQIALTLKSLCGLSVGEIANALLSSASTINKRLYRAKQKFRDGSIQFELPNDDDLIERLDNVFSSLYLLFNEGYYSAHNEKLIRMDLCFEAIRLTKELIAHFPNSNKAKAMLSLMLLSVARFESRTDQNEAIIILAKQDRTSWDKNLITQGIDYLHQASSGKEISSYHLQAGIAAEHCLAESFQSTNWTSIHKQYTLLQRIASSPIILFNKAISKYYGVAKDDALADLIALKDSPELQKNLHYHTALGVFYTELNEKEKASSFFETALKLSNSSHEQTFIKSLMN
jgi:RNA polymerase sigma factor (sigma-70 family)